MLEIPPFPAPAVASARLGPLHGAADALALARRASERPPLAIVCGSATDAQRLVEEMRWFAPALRIALFPDWETLPYDNFSPHADLVSERLETLYRVTGGDIDVLVVPASTALYRLRPPRTSLHTRSLSGRVPRSTSRACASSSRSPDTAMSRR